MDLYEGERRSIDLILVNKSTTLSVDDIQLSVEYPNLMTTLNLIDFSQNNLNSQVSTYLDKVDIFEILIITCSNTQLLLAKDGKMTLASSTKTAKRYNTRE